MRIALIGYGKMGKEIEKIALERGHSISLKVTSENRDYKPEDLKETDVAIEFSVPGAAYSNISKCLEAGVPVAVGTTGWYDKLEELTDYCNNNKGAILHATNFSIGVNIFFELNKKLAELMNPHKDYEPNITEIHHVQKLDAPSGTAITLAEGLLTNFNDKNHWVNEPSNNKTDLEIVSLREPEVPGTHTIKYENEIDKIEITHTAHNRKGFALGSVLAAEWLTDKNGVFTMQDMLNL